MDQEVVATGIVEIGYSILAGIVDGRTVYEWMTDSGDSSSEWFTTRDDAERDVQSYY